MNLTDNQPAVNEATNKRKLRISWSAVAVTIPVFVLVVILWGALGLYVAGGFPECKEKAGTFGDAFGAVNALFSGLAFAGVLIALWFQSQELSLQREELQDTRVELSKSATAQAELVSMNALTTLVQHHQRNYETNPPFYDNELMEIALHAPNKITGTLRYRLLNMTYLLEQRCSNETQTPISLIAPSSPKIMGEKAWDNLMRDTVGDFTRQYNDIIKRWRKWNEDSGDFEEKQNASLFDFVVICQQAQAKLEVLRKRIENVEEDRQTLTPLLDRAIALIKDKTSIDSIAKHDKKLPIPEGGRDVVEALSAIAKATPYRTRLL